MPLFHTKLTQLNVSFPHGLIPQTIVGPVVTDVLGTACASLDTRPKKTDEANGQFDQRVARTQVTIHFVDCGDPFCNAKITDLVEM